MHNRFARETSGQQITEQFAVKGAWSELPPNRDIRPTDLVHAAALGGDSTRRLINARWGMFDGDGRLIPDITNARNDKLASAPLWKPLLAGYVGKAQSFVPPRRCLVPFDAWYE